MHDQSVPAGTCAVLVRTVRGIESVAAAEIGARLRVRSPELGHREVRFRARLTGEALALGTADDAFLVLYDGPAIGHRRSALRPFGTAAARALDLAGAAAVLSSLRRVEGGSFDVTASFRGRRNYSRYELEDALGAAVGAASG